jgi:hypothetical protein
MKTFIVGQDVGPVKAGRTFRFQNISPRDCTATGCRPPLEQDLYLVPAKNHADAKVDDDATPAPPDDPYTYQCDCSNLDANPRIIIK